MLTRFLLITLASLVALPEAHADERTKGFAKELQSDKPSECRVAQAYLAHSGAEAVPELATLADRPDAALRQRLKETVNLMLLNTVEPGLIRQYPKLWQLAAPELKKASTAAAKLAGQKEYDSGELGLIPPNAEQPPRTAARQAVHELVGLNGFAVPAALDLLVDEEPGSRMYGVEILGRLDAVAQLQTLQRMRHDAGRISVSHGCYEDDTTVGAYTPVWLAAGGLRRAIEQDTKYAVTLEAERYVVLLAEFAGRDSYAILDDLRRQGRTLEAESWEDYWDRAKPILQAKWDRP